MTKPIHARPTPQPVASEERDVPDASKPAEVGAEPSPAASPWRTMIEVAPALVFGRAQAEPLIQIGHAVADRIDRALEPEDQAAMREVAIAQLEMKVQARVEARIDALREQVSSTRRGLLGPGGAAGRAALREPLRRAHALQKKIDLLDTQMVAEGPHVAFHPVREVGSMIGAQLGLPPAPGSMHARVEARAALAAQLAEVVKANPALGALDLFEVGANVGDSEMQAALHKGFEAADAALEDVRQRVRSGDIDVLALDSAVEATLREMGVSRASARGGDPKSQYIFEHLDREARTDRVINLAVAGAGAAVTVAALLSTGPLAVAALTSAGLALNGSAAAWNYEAADDLRDAAHVGLAGDSGLADVEAADSRLAWATAEGVLAVADGGLAVRNLAQGARAIRTAKAALPKAAIGPRDPTIVTQGPLTALPARPKPPSAPKATLRPDDPTLVSSPAPKATIRPNDPTLVSGPAPRVTIRTDGPTPVSGPAPKVTVRTDGPKPVSGPAPKATIRTDGPTPASSPAPKATIRPNDPTLVSSPAAPGRMARLKVRVTQGEVRQRVGGAPRARVKPRAERAERGPRPEPPQTAQPRSTAAAKALEEIVGAEAAARLVKERPAAELLATLRDHDPAALGKVITVLPTKRLVLVLEQATPEQLTRLAADPGRLQALARRRWPGFRRALAAVLTDLAPDAKAARAAVPAPRLAPDAKVARAAVPAPHLAPDAKAARSTVTAPRVEASAPTMPDAAPRAEPVPMRSGVWASQGREVSSSAIEEFIQPVVVDVELRARAAYGEARNFLDGISWSAIRHAETLKAIEEAVDVVVGSPAELIRRSWRA